MKGFVYTATARLYFDFLLGWGYNDFRRFVGDIAAITSPGNTPRQGQIWWVTFQNIWGSVKLRGRGGESRFAAALGPYLRSGVSER